MGLFRGKDKAELWVKSRKGGKSMSIGHSKGIRIKKVS